MNKDSQIVQDNIEFFPLVVSFKGTVLHNGHSNSPAIGFDKKQMCTL